MKYRLFMASTNDAVQEIEVTSWHRKCLSYLAEAKAAASKSKDLSTQVGAVVIDVDHSLRVSGRNGFPRRINDDVAARHERPAKYMWTAHAEENCFNQAARMGVSLMGCMLLVTSLHPCTRCSRGIIQTGISTVYAPLTNANPTWDEESVVAMEMLKEAGIIIYYYEEIEE